jgi:hypothetical protein
VPAEEVLKILAVQATDDRLALRDGKPGCNTHGG